MFVGIVSDPEGGEMIDRDSPTFNYEPHVTYLKVSYSIAMLYFSLISAVKISIVLMYRRIFSTPSFRLHSLILAVCVFFWWITGTVTTGVYCVPLERYWVGPSVGGYCYNYNIFWMVMGVLEVIIDAVILVLPIRMVLQLRLTRQSKILIIGIFLLGSLYVNPTVQ